MLPPAVLHKILNSLVPGYLLTYKPDNRTRLCVQKAMYLFQIFMDCDVYGFSWYFSGPFCSELGHQIDDMILDQQIDQQPGFSALTLSDAARAAISKVNDLMTEARALRSGTPDSLLYELLASALYTLQHDRIQNVFDLSREQLGEVIHRKLKLLHHYSSFTAVGDLVPYIQLILDRFGPGSEFAVCEKPARAV